MATGKTKTQSGMPWHKAGTFMLLLISLGTIAYTVLVTKELAVSIAHLKKEITRLERDCTQRVNALHANEHATLRSKTTVSLYFTPIENCAKCER